MRRWLYNFLGTDFGRGVFGIAAVLLIFSPAFFFGRAGLVVVFVAIVAFYGGYQFARWEWRRRGFVPEWDEDTSDDPVIVSPRPKQPPQ